MIDFEVETSDSLEMQKLREKRLAQLKKEASFEAETFGTLTPISLEKEAVHMIAHSAKLVIHFRMPSFRRCAIMSDHLAVLAKLHQKTRFVEVNADDVPFLVAKFKIQVLPCLVAIIMGQVVDKIVGFDELGGSDNFPTGILAQRLMISGAIAQLASSESVDSDSDSYDE